MDQQRDIQVAGGDQKHFNAGHGQCIQGTSGHTAAGNHVLAKKVQFGIADTDQRGSLGILVQVGG